MTSARVLCLFALLVAITADANCHNHVAPPVIPKVAVAEPEVNQAFESTATENFAAPQKVTWLDEASKIGQCCDADKFWSGDKVTGIGGCCDEDKHWSQDETSGLGKCCAPGHEFAGDKARGVGSCCPNGYRWSAGRCKRVPQSQAAPQLRVQASAATVDNHQPGM
ncbi:hypothetical protein BDN71DRAFT_1429758 [Pleurotus eryngii]|uniref:Uncharacterized protein n=1 Tax=Pleurotus eryngii TaxID=5323 RepID=A0A9P6D8P7_PLEER|nr:hypothetical protein BDN71DRAFT_1429758 [Pleurotus eryngii]